MKFTVDPTNTFDTRVVVRLLKKTYPHMGVSYRGGEDESIVIIRFGGEDGRLWDTPRPQREHAAIRAAVETQTTIRRMVSNGE